MRAHAAAFLSDLAARPDLPEAGVAHRVAGITCWFAGDYREARDRLERALALFQPGRDDDLAYRFGWDPGVAAMGQSGGCLVASRREIDRAISLIDLMNDAGRGLDPCQHARVRQIVRGHVRIDARRPPPRHRKRFRTWSASRVNTSWGHASGVRRVSRGLDVPLQAGTSGNGLEDMRRGVEQLREQNILFFDGLLKIALAEAEARAGDLGRAVAILDEALATADRIGYRAFQVDCIGARRHAAEARPPRPRARRRSLPDRDHASPSNRHAQPRTASSAVASQALSIDRRPAEAHAILAPALEGFAPTPEMPEIAEAQAVLAALAETDDVKAAEAQRERQLQLESAYSYAIGWSKGYNADETKASLARIAELTGRTNDFSARFGAFMGQFAAATTGGESGSARDLALTVLREAQDAGRAREAAAANWWLGLVAYWRGEFVEARTQCERALAAPDLNPDPKAWETSVDRVSTWAPSCLAAIMWQLGEVERARELINSANRRASEVGDVGAIANALFWKSYLEIWRGDPFATLSAAEALETVAREHGLTQYLNEAELHASWARGRMDDPAAGAAQVRRVLRLSSIKALRSIWGSTRACSRSSRRKPFRRTARWLASTKLSTSQTRSSIVARSRSCIDCAAKSCSSATQPIPLPPRKHCAHLSPSRRSKARVVPFFSRPSLSPSCINRRPPHRSPRHPRASARRLCTDAGNARDRGSGRR